MPRWRLAEAIDQVKSVSSSPSKFLPRHLTDVAQGRLKQVVVFLSSLELLCEEHRKLEMIMCLFHFLFRFVPVQSGETSKSCRV